MGAFDEGNSFLTSVLLAKLPEALRAQVKDAFDKAEAKDAVTLLGDSVLARSDYSRKMDDLRKQDTLLKDQLAAATDLYERNQVWYRTNEGALKEYPTLRAELDRLKAGGGTGGNGNGDGDGHAPPSAAELKKLVEDTLAASLDTTLADRERGYVDVVSFMMDTGEGHRQLFGTPVNMRELTSHPKLGRQIAGQPAGRVFSLQDAYHEKYGEAVLAKQKEAHDTLIEAEVQKRLTEEKKKLIGQPFPLRGEAGPSVLDVLDTKEGPAAHTLDAAVAAYEQLQAGRGL